MRQKLFASIRTKGYNELTDKMEIHSQSQKTYFWLPKWGRGEGYIRRLGITQSTIYKTDNQQGPTV